MWTSGTACFQLPGTRMTSLSLPVDMFQSCSLSSACFLFYVACFSHIFFGIFFFCTLKVCKLRRRRRIKYPYLHCSRGVWVCDCVRAVQSSDWGRYMLWDFFFVVFFWNDILKFVVLCSLALWTCCYSFKWPRMVIDCMFVFLPFTYILRTYRSYLCFTTLTWCVCEAAHTCLTVFMPFACLIAAPLMPKCLLSPPRCLSYFPPFLSFPSIPHISLFLSQQHNQISKQERVWTFPESLSDIFVVVLMAAALWRFLPKLRQGF